MKSIAKKWLVVLRKWNSCGRHWFVRFYNDCCRLVQAEIKTSNGHKRTTASIYPEVSELELCRHIISTREKHLMAACINWTFIIIVLVLFLAVLRYDVHRATYAFQSHQKIGLFSILNFHMRLLWRNSPIFYSSCLSHSGWIHDSCNKCLENSDCIKNMCIWGSKWRSYSTSTITPCRIKIDNDGKCVFIGKIKGTECCQEGTNHIIHKNDHMK